MSWAARSSPSKNSANDGGGAVHTVFQCTRCSRHYTFDSTILPERPTAGQNDLSKAMQVALITAGLTHATYKKVLDILGMAAVSFLTFQGTIQELHPIVEQMVKEMCQREKERMKGTDQDKLFSWSKAVTCADGTWQTRGYHSKNATYTIRNYANGALLSLSTYAKGAKTTSSTSHCTRGHPSRRRVMGPQG